MGCVWDYYDLIVSVAGLGGEMLSLDLLPSFGSEQALYNEIIVSDDIMKGGYLLIG